MKALGSAKNLISIPELIKLATKKGVSFGSGNANNRLRYLTKIGLIPHAIRQQPAPGIDFTVGYYPYEVLDLLVEIDKFARQGLAIPAIMEKMGVAVKPKIEFPEPEIPRADAYSFYRETRVKKGLDFRDVRGIGDVGEVGRREIRRTAGRVLAYAGALGVAVVFAVGVIWGMGGLGGLGIVRDKAPITAEVLGENITGGFLEINADTKIYGQLSLNDVPVNLDQDLLKKSSPTFSSLVLSSLTNQVKLGDGTLLTLVGTENKQTLTNKTISGSANTLKNIPNSALDNSKVTVTAGTNLTGGGDVSLGSSVTISALDNPVFASVSASRLYVNGIATTSGNIMPAENGVQNLGSASYFWNNLFVNNIYGASSGVQGYWQRAGGALAPANITDDFLVGGISTAAARFQVFGLTGNATTSGTLGAGGNTTINADLAVKGNLNLTTGSVYQINGTSVLSATTLGSGVTTSSLTTVGTLISLAATNATISGTLGVGGEASLSAKLILGSTTPQINATNNRNLQLGFQNTGRVEFGSTGTYIDSAGNFALAGKVASHLIPSVASTYDLGSTANPWRAIYVGDVIMGGGSGQAGWWQKANGVIAPTSITDDLVIGGTATASAKFQVYGLTGNTVVGGGLTASSGLTVSAGNISLTGSQTIDATGTMGVGTIQQTSLTMGRAGAPTTIIGSTVTISGGLFSGPNATISGTLGVGGEASVSGKLVLDSATAQINAVRNQNLQLGFQNTGRVEFGSTTTSIDSSGNIRGATWLGNTVGVGYGGTGVTSLADVLGTTNQITVSNGTARVIGGNVTLSLPSDLSITNATASGNLGVGGEVNTKQFRLNTAPTAGYILVADANGIGTWQSLTGGAGGISGSGTSGKIARFTGTSTVGDASIADTGTTATASGTLGVGGEASLSAKLILGSLTPQINATNMRNLQLGFQNTGRVEFGTANTFIDLSGNLTLAGLTASKAVFTDANKTLTSTGTVGTAQGGTGITSAPAAGQLLIGNSAGGYTLNTLNGTTNQVNITNNSGAITLATPQDIATTSSPTFTGLTLNGVAYTWPSANASGVLTDNGSGTLTWSASGTVGTNWWDQIGGAVYPKDTTVDLLAGGTSTATAKFAFINVNAGTPTATIAGNLSLSGTTIATTKKQTLNIGDASTGNIAFSSTIGVTYGGTGVTALSDVLGTANQITVSNGTARVIGGNITLSLPQSIATNSSPTFTGLTLNTIAYTFPSSQTAGGVLTTDGSGTLTWSSTGGSGSIGYWQRALGALSPTNITDDLILGATATAGAKFRVSGTTGNATTSGTLGAGGNTQIDANLNVKGDVTLNKVTTGTWNGTTVAVGYGGTGVTSLSDVLGTTNQVTVTNGTARVIGANVTLSLPQDIATGSSPTFGGLTIAGNATVSGNLGIGGEVNTKQFRLNTAPTAGYVLVADANGIGTWQSVVGGGAGGVGGSGTANTMAKFTGTSTIGNSSITDTGSLITLGVNATASGNLAVGGEVNTKQFRLNTAPTSGYVLVADANGIGTWQSVVGGGAGGIGGSGTSGKIARFTGTSTIGDASIADTGTTATASGTLGVGGEASLSAKLILDSLTPQINATNLRNLQLGFQNTGRVEFGTANSYIDLSGNLTLAGLTASKAVFTDANKMLTSTGTVAVAQGGTGVTSLSDVLGTTNQITVTNGTARVIGANVTLSLPQDIATGSSPTFGGLTIAGNATVSGTLGVGGNLTLSGVAGDTTVTNALFLNGSNIVTQRALGSNAFNSTAFLTTAVTSATGTSNQVTVSGSTGAVTFSLPAAVLLGAGPLEATAILQLDSTTKGFLGPRMTTTERDAISTPATGLLIYNSTTNQYNVYNGTTWGAVGGTSATSQWQLNSGVISPFDVTQSLAIGGTATATAKFLVNGVNGNASTSGSLTLSSAGVIASTAKQSLTIGDASTGNINFYDTNTYINSSGNLTLAGLTASKAVFTDANKTLTSTGTVGVGQGGTGVTSNPASGQLLIGNSTNGFNLAALTQGSANQVIITNASGAITLSLPQDIATGSLPTFGGLTIAGNATVSGTLGAGGNTTINADLAVKGNLNVLTGSVYQVGGTGVLSATTLGSGVTTSSLTTVGTLISLAATNATISGTLGAGGNTTLNGDLGIKGNTTFTGKVNSHLIPLSDNNFDLGSVTNAWRNLYISGNIYGAANGTLGYWQRLSGVLAPYNITDDLVIGGISTAAAKFQVYGLTGNTTVGGDITMTGSRLIDTTVTMGVGTVQQTSLTLGRSGAPTTINGSTVTINGLLTSGVNATLSGTLGVGGDASLSAKLNFDSLTPQINATNMRNLQLGFMNTGRVEFGTANTYIDLSGNLTLAGLTASKAVFTDANKMLTSTGTVGVAQGGTGVSSWTNGQLLIGNTSGNTAALGTLTGTTNQITVTNGASAITLATPQDIATGSTPTFGGLTIAGNATISGTLGVGGEASLSAKLILGSLTPQINATNNRNLNLGFQNTGRIEFLATTNYLSATALSLTTGSAYQINGTDVLSATTLGTGVLTSSLTSVGALASGSIASGFGTIATANTITGTTINGTTGINTGAGAGTNRIDVSGNLLNINSITATSATISGNLSLGPQVTPGTCDAGAEGKMFYNMDQKQIWYCNGSVWQMIGTGGANTNYWGLDPSYTVVSLTQSTRDVTFGGTATSSAKFQIFGLTGNASSAGNLTFSTAATIATTAMQSLNLGDASTGNIILSNNASISGNLTFFGGARTIANTNMQSLTIGSATTGNTTLTSGNLTQIKAGGTGTGSTGTGSIYFLNSSGTTRGRYDTTSATATGGTITTSGGYTIHTFTSSGTFTPANAGNVEYLVVAGGGGGGSGGGYGGGGGAGGFRTATGFAVTAQGYTVTVGAGGAGGPSNNYIGSNGNNSVFSTITSTGGGGGGTNSNNGSAGGSGGGGGYPTQTGGAGNTPSTSPSQGNNGGDHTVTWGAGGGGGASAVGANGSGDTGGNGGAGTASSISGSSVTYAGGGGGAGSTNGSGGAGGGGAAASPGVNGTANTGGGGGGSIGAAGNGGSGIVIIRYLTSDLTSYGTLYLGATNTSAADLAEYYVTGDRSIEAGDVVAISNTKVKIASSSATPRNDEEEVQTKGVLRKAEKPYDAKLLGIISTNPGVVMGSIDGDTGKEDKRMLALAGRVPVKIASTSAAIKIGDFLTASEVPGRAQKATKYGYVVGKALEDWSAQGGFDTIEVIVGVGLADPNLDLAGLADLLVTKKSPYGDLVDSASSPSGWTDNLGSILLQNQNFVKGIFNLGVDLPGIGPGELGLSVQLSDPARPTPISLSQLLVGLVNEGASNSAAIASLSGILKNDISGQLALIPEIKSQIELLQEEMASVSGRLAKVESVATASANLSNLTNWSNLEVATLSAEFGNFSESLKVIGKTQLANTTIGGALQVGLLHFDDLKAEISSLTGLVTISGDASVSGRLRVGKGIVLPDTATGENYCVQITNGEIVKTKGDCP